MRNGVELAAHKGLSSARVYYVLAIQIEAYPFCLSYGRWGGRSLPAPSNGAC